MTQPEAVRLIAGRYRLESLIGSGGMAAVWRAVDTTLERPVAVKLLHARDERQHAARIDRFKREARIAAAVAHSNVVRIIDFGTTEQETPFMVMEMLNGENLGARLKREPRPELDEIVRIAAATLRGLEAAHTAGIVHRDIKPENVFLHREGGRLVPKLLDFGISRLVEADGRRVSAHTTKVGVLVGTAEYMSPEQVRGGAALDLRTDIYSMGVVLYEALLGRVPFESKNVGDLLVEIVSARPPLLHEQRADVPRAISDVVHKAMAREPSQRYTSAAEMRDALLAALEAKHAPERASAPASSADARERAKPLAAAPPPAAAPAPAVPAPTLVLSEPAPKTRRRALLAVAAITAAGVGLWLVYAGWRDDPGSPASQAQAGAARPAAAPVPLPATIAVELRGVPVDARVTVDGELEQAPLRLPRDGRNRLIRVSAPGKESWQIVHHASADGAYDVVLLPAAAPHPKAAPRARPRHQATAPRAAPEPPNALQRLDF